MTTREELELCYKYYLHMKAGNVKNIVSGFNMRFYDGFFNPNDTFYGFILALRGFNGFPKIVKDEEFKKLKNKVYFHGFKEYDYGAEMLSSRIYNLGTGTCSPGLYFTSENSEAFMYTGRVNEKKDKNKVISAVCLGNKMPDITSQALDFVFVKNHNFASCIKNKNDKAKIEELQTFCKTLPVEDKSKFYNLFRGSVATMCAFLGYDYMLTGYSHMIVTNRAKLVIPESNARKIFDNSENFKDVLGKQVIVEDLSPALEK